MNRSLINEALQNLELLDIFLFSSSVSRFSKITDSSYPEKMSQEDKLGISAEFLEIVEKGEDSPKKLVDAKVQLAIKYTVEDNTEVLAEIESCFLARYTLQDGASEEAVDEFMKYNVIHNVWPFWREHVLRISAEARLPRPCIPLFKQQPAPD